MAFCLPHAENLVSMQVLYCRSVSFGDSKLDFVLDSEKTIEIQSPGEKGVLISGKIMESELVTRSTRTQNILHREPFKIDSFQSVFVLGQVNEICTMNGAEIIQFVTSKPCCDVSGMRGACAVPSGIAVVKFVSDREGWYLWEEASHK